MPCGQSANLKIPQVIKPKRSKETKYKHYSEVIKFFTIDKLKFVIKFFTMGKLKFVHITEG